MGKPASALPDVILEAWGDTDVGMKRRLNEDVYLIDEENGVYLVADGMGGHTAGEVASRIAANAIQSVLRNGKQLEDVTWPEHWDTERSAAANSLVDAIIEAHARVTEAVSANQELKGMGTTVVAAVHPNRGRRLVIGHVGDSRAYLLRERELEVLTDDHSWVHEQVTAGFLSEEAARSHPLKNVVTQALGGSTQPHVDILEIDLHDDDVFLLCSDGLNTMLTDERIAELLTSSDTLADVGRQLIVAANQAGGNDNVSVVLVRVKAAVAGR